MTCLHDKIAQLHRPRLLIRAARFGLPEYRRDHVLRRLRLSGQTESGQPGQTGIVERLIEAESRCEMARLEADPGYRVARHVEILVALMAESRLLPHPASAPEVRAPDASAPAPHRACASDPLAGGTPCLARPLAPPEVKSPQSEHCMPLRIAGWSTTAGGAHSIGKCVHPS